MLLEKIPYVGILWAKNFSLVCNLSAQIFDILNSYGLNIKENLVLDQSCNQVNVQQQMGIFRMAVPMDYQFLPILKSFSNK